MTTQLYPLNWALTIGNTSAQILPSNPSRRSLMFHNPSNVTVSICPALAPGGAAVPAVVGGAGSMTIFPGALLVLPQPGQENVGLGSAWNAIAAAPATPFTVWEF